MTSRTPDTLPARVMGKGLPDVDPYAARHHEPADTHLRRPQSVAVNGRSRSVWRMWHALHERIREWSRIARGVR